MKKSTKILGVVLAAVAVVALVVINRNNNKEQEKLIRSKQLTVVVKGEEKIYSYNESGDEYVTFDTQMKRKNGDVFEKNYSGIQLISILNECGAELDENVHVVATCADNYQISLTKAEIEEDRNIYLVTAENGRPLSEEDGVFMLVINNDEFSTRWAKNIISITVE